MKGSEKAPDGLGTSGRALWDAVAGPYELEQHERVVLLQAGRCADYLDQLSALAASEPLTVTNSRGDEVVHPAITEHRQQSITLSRLLASLRVPTGDEAERPQRRGASRGFYGVRGTVSS